MSALPSNVGTRLITGRFIVGVTDGADEDMEPDVIAAKGTITFTASVGYIPIPGATGGPVTYLKSSIVGIFNEDGYLCTPDPSDPEKAGAVGVRLVVTDNPEMLVKDWTWTATYRFSPVNGSTPAVPTHSFLLPAGEPLDLSEVVRVPSSGGVGIAQAEAAALRAEEYAAVALEVKQMAESGAFRGLPGEDGANVLPTDLAVEAALSKRLRDYNTGNNSELVETLPVPLAATAADKRVIYSTEIPDLKIGDLLMTTSEFQVTNDLGYNVMVMTQIILGETAETVAGTEITESNGRNVTPAAHHDSFPKVGTIRVSAVHRKFVNVVAWCGASNAQPGHTIQVDPDYGRLSIVRF